MTHFWFCVACVTRENDTNKNVSFLGHFSTNPDTARARAAHFFYGSLCETWVKVLAVTHNFTPLT